MIKYYAISRKACRFSLSLIWRRGSVTWYDFCQDFCNINDKLNWPFVNKWFDRFGWLDDVLIFWSLYLKLKPQYSRVRTFWFTICFQIWPIKWKHMMISRTKFWKSKKLRFKRKTERQKIKENRILCSGIVQVKNTAWHS